jgi:hypothetical protein
MKNYRLLNNLLGWITFAIASFVYLSTIEPTASWWDCGEYISTAFKLQVGHPPGAPLFQMIGRFFSLFAFGDVSHVAMMVNAMSALCSAFTILFLFWSITALALKFVTKSDEMTAGEMYAILGSGLVGALAYTFSDSFWFSAVEGEVYAMSSFFTALVFWAILRWERVADEPHAFKWIILIAYFMGLSIGVHLLNLLAIPAIAFIYYFKKYKPSRNGIILTGIVSLIILSLIMFVIIPWIVNLAGKFELFFVNTLGLPFNSGTVVYFILLLGAIAWGLNYTIRKKKALYNTLILCFTFILIGYSSFFMLVIRANANTPINENNPDDAISLLSYLNREQYGDWPILYGQYYNAPLDPQTPYKDGTPIYVRDAKAHKYIITSDRKNTIPNYDSRFCTLFPRMWSNQKSSHVSAYKAWGKVEGTPIDVTNEDGKTETLYKPTFGENLRFFFDYQIGHMYLRYFMWNFAGRQNDIEGHGGIKNGNWISGINYFDSNRLGDQSNLPQSMQNRANNKFYFLPLILGLVGMYFHFRKHYTGAIVVALMFLMTGLAIVVYLNQYPFQPRERDYAYAGSFYAFAFWIGFGVYFLFDMLRKINEKAVAIGVTAVCLLLVPGIMAKEGWNDHDRSGKYACRDFAADYLNSCAPNAILITNGDNDTFPLWYAQEVEGIRTDVRVVNYMLASGEWYVHQLGRKIYNSDQLPFTLTPEQYNKGVNEMIPFYEMSKERLALKDVIDFIASDDERAKLPLQSGEKIHFLPTKHLTLAIDSAYMVNNGLIPKYMAGNMVKSIDWDVKSNYLYKNDLMFLDFLATNNWKRPVYFATPSSVSDVLDIEKYCHQEGFVSRFLPVIAKGYIEGLGGVDAEGSYDIMMNKCKWGNLADPKVYVDRESYRNSMIPKQNFIRLAIQLMEEGKKDMAVKAIDRCQEAFPNSKITYDYYMMQFADIYYKCGATAKGSKLVETLAGIYEENLNYYSSLSPEFSANYQSDMEQGMAVLDRLASMAKENKQEAIAKKIDQFMQMKSKIVK